MEYPGRLITTGEKDAHIVGAVKLQLNTLLALDGVPELRLDPANPNFGAKTKQLVRLFQARNVDSAGRPLVQDGVIGSLTWAALFGERSVPSSTSSPNALLAAALRIAGGEAAKGVREVPRNSNSGPEVDAYLARTGLGPGHAWCCAFIYWCFDEAAKAEGVVNPMVKTAGCLEHWKRAPDRGAKRIHSSHARDNPALLEPGMLFIMDYGRGAGHTGFIEQITGGILTTIEGNTDASRTREGGGVYRLQRKVGEINKGYIDYGSA